MITYQNCCDILTRAGLKNTQVRISILTYLSTISHPMDIEAISNALHKDNKHVNATTVYRTIETFVRHNLVERIDFLEGKFRYEYKDSDHHHLICTKCGSIRDISTCPVQQITKSVQKTQGFVVTKHALEFFGLCAQCQKI